MDLYTYNNFQLRGILLRMKVVCECLHCSCSIKSENNYRWAQWFPSKREDSHWWADTADEECTKRIVKRRQRVRHLNERRGLSFTWYEGHRLGDYMRSPACNYVNLRAFQNHSSRQLMDCNLCCNHIWKCFIPPAMWSAPHKSHLIQICNASQMLRYMIH